MKKVKRKHTIIFSILIMSLLILIFILNFGYKGQKQALKDLKSDNLVTVKKGKYIIFIPKVKTETGFILYPGAKVKAQAYAPICKKIAQKGYLVISVPMPFDLAPLGKNKATEIEKLYPEIKYWAIGGHSLGGAVASEYVYENPSKATALILYDSYPARKLNMINYNIKVLSTWGTNSIAKKIDAIENSRHILPNNSIFRPICGGNHIQFADTNMPDGGNKPTMSMEKQHKFIANYTVEFLSQLAKNTK